MCSRSLLADGELLETLELNDLELVLENDGKVNIAVILLNGIAGTRGQMNGFCDFFFVLFYLTDPIIPVRCLCSRDRARLSLD